MSPSPLRPTALLAALALLAVPAAAQQLQAPPRAPAETSATPDGGIRDGALRIWFSNLDLDGNNWVSLREAEAGLRFDRGRFRTFDADRDGRMSMAEYRDFLRREREVGRRPPEPSSTPPRPLAPRRDPQQMRVAFDRDLDGGLDVRELQALLVHYGEQQVDASSIFRRFDQNGDNRLSVDELGPIAFFFDPIAQRRSGTAAPPTRGSLFELFGTPEPRGVGQAPRIIGPVLPFMRLDLDNDGLVEADDLETLRGRLYLSVSIAGILNTLDLDSDGHLSAAEFRVSIDPSAQLGPGEQGR